ncbi:MAG: ROK family protein [[Pasteurella] mairii]|uniref:N-acetylglucosamine repressor n=1 Tax=[Pasteurella] mairii TaxID=757 RepID=A0A379B861_9PAST|nr:ROK family protein [[Pasteurella] mairii]SUB34662.1 N-acetylglucosamine repressor [[Pasteurella] mairii]
MTIATKIKKNNYQNIYRLFFEKEKLSKQQIAFLLKLSLPTVVHNVMELEATQKIRECGQMESQGGRPAIAYELVKDAFVAIGIEIKSEQIKCAVLDLFGNIIWQKKEVLLFVKDEHYLIQLAHLIEQFILDTGYTQNKILGIGLSIQGIAEKNGQFMLYSKAFPCHQFNIAKLSEHINLPIKLFHDVKCAASAELWRNKNLNNAVYLSISEHLGGTTIINNQIDFGKNGFSGALEHLQIYDNGKVCYCGQKGCLEAYCSLSALLQQDSKELFFTQLRAGNSDYQMRWNLFLTHLAKGLNYVALMLDRDIVLGGKISPYLIQDDLDLLRKKMEAKATFSLDNINIQIAQQQSNAEVIGAGLYFIKHYLS